MATSTAQVGAILDLENLLHAARRSADEACAYLAHPLLGARLREGVAAMLSHRGRSAQAILGGIDALKFRSCLTLFEAVADEPALFAEALAAFYDGGRDERTLELLGR